jgi:hypothetical protein
MLAHGEPAHAHVVRIFASEIEDAPFLHSMLTERLPSALHMAMVRASAVLFYRFAL